MSFNLFYDTEEKSNTQSSKDNRINMPIKNN